ncbi:hypothetical protein RCL1_003506 [Eukaryota sp. TZLM3-RCL]
MDTSKIASSWPTLHKLIYWERPVVSGLTVVIGTFTYILTRFGSWSLTSLLSLLAFFVFSLGYLKKRAVRAMRGGSISPDQNYQDKEFIRRETVHSFVEGMVNPLNNIVAFVSKIASFHDESLTVRAIGASIALFILGRIFCGVTLLFFGFLYIMAVPKVLNTYPQQVAFISRMIFNYFTVYVNMAMTVFKRYLVVGKTKAMEFINRSGFDTVLARFGIIPVLPTAPPKEE